MDATRSIMEILSKSCGLETLKALKNGEKTLIEIAKIIQADKSTVHRRLREFVELGWVTERFDYKDRRLKYSLTYKGKNILKAIETFEQEVSVVVS